MNRIKSLALTLIWIAVALPLFSIVDGCGDETPSVQLDSGEIETDSQQSFHSDTPTKITKVYGYELLFAMQSAEYEYNDSSDSYQMLEESISEGTPDDIFGRFLTLTLPFGSVLLFATAALFLALTLKHSIKPVSDLYTSSVRLTLVISAYLLYLQLEFLRSFFGALQTVQEAGGYCLFSGLLLTLFLALQDGRAARKEILIGETSRSKYQYIYLIPQLLNIFAGLLIVVLLTLSVISCLDASGVFNIIRHAVMLYGIIQLGAFLHRLSHYADPQEYKRYALWFILPYGTSILPIVLSFAIFLTI